MQIMKPNFCHNTKYEPLAKFLASINCVILYVVFQHAVYVLCTVEPLYNGQMSAEALSVIRRCPLFGGDPYWEVLS